jgi:hypothetical protein
MKRLASMLLAGLLLASACSDRAQPAQAQAPALETAKTANAAKTAAYDAAVAPTNKQVLRALLDNLDVSLSTDSSCAGVGTEPADANIGDYISGFLAEQNSDKGKNWLEVVTKRASPAPGADQAWQCNVVIRHIDGDDRWGWGVSFLMKGRDHSVVKTSFRCTGSG